MKKYIFVLFFLLFLSIPIVLWSLPADYFDSGRTVCLSVWLLNVECWGCGLTRATMHLLHFDFEIAYHYNKLAFVLFPLLVYVWGNYIFYFWKKIN
ncbi:MAG: DUF2752 domain-containing protein [Aureispira sp.]|nr:DUF2752 domain-containing protein [Aureispira sp.]